MMITPKDVAIDNGINPNYDAPCPHCGNDEVGRNCEVGISIKGGARLCSDCIDVVMPHANLALDLIWDLQCGLEECSDPEQFVAATVQLLTVAIEHMLLGSIFDFTEPARSGLRLVPSESA